MEVVFSQQAELDLEEIADTIVIDSAPAAIRFIQAIREHCARIGLTPLNDDPCSTPHRALAQAATQI